MNFHNFLIGLNQNLIFYLYFPHLNFDSSHFEIVEFHLHIFQDFLRYGNDFWCKRKMRIHTLQIKSFSSHILVFYFLFLRLKIVQNPICVFGNMDFQRQVGGKKLVGGGKKLFICKVWIFNFHFQKNELKIL